MRFVATALMWLLTTILLAVAIPAAWVQQHLIDGDGYASLAQQAAADPGLQTAMASELTAQITRLGSNVSPAVVNLAAARYTASPAFPAQFAQANRFAHSWLFTDTVRSSVDAQGRWVIDFAPMLADSAFKQTLSENNLTLPSSVPVPLTDNAPAALRPGVLRPAATWGPWVSIALAVLAGLSALFTLFISRSRGKGFVALGISGLLVGAAGWAGIEFGRRSINSALDNTSGDIRRVAEVMVGTAERSLHQWLNVTLIIGGGLVIVGVIVILLASLAKSG